MDAQEQKRSVYDDYEADDGSPRPNKVPRTSGFFGTALRGMGQLLSTPQRALNDIAARASSMSPSRQTATRQEDSVAEASANHQPAQPSPVKKLFAAAVPSFSPGAASSSSALAKPSPRSRTPKQVTIASPATQQQPKSSARKGGKTPTQQAKPSPSKSTGGPVIAYMSELEDGASASPAKSPGKQQAKSPSARRSLSAEQIFYIARIADHRAAEGDEPEVLVEWEGADAGAPSWEPEAVIQQDAPEALFEYWASKAGGRGAYPPYAGPDGIDVVFAIVGHEWVAKKAGGAGTKRKRGVAAASKKGGRAPAKELKLKVQWLGFEEATLEDEKSFRKDQPKLVQLYWTKVGGRPLQPGA